jgi:outer membrane lipase/esterase
VIAPGQISFLPETAVKTRSRLVANIQQQIDAGRQDTGPSMFRAWVTGDTSYLQMDSYHGFPDQAGQPQALAAGIGIANGPFIAGGAISFGQLESDFGAGRGSFKQDEVAGSLYAGFLPNPFWATVVGTYGKLDYDVTRLVPIGITTETNLGNTKGTNLSVAAQVGVATTGCLRTGPFAGLTWQRVEVDGFTETGDYTSLSFGDQTRESTVATAGLKATTHCGVVRPFGQISYSQELASTGREVTASLTTTGAPSYHMPAVELGKNWGSATLGAHFIFTPSVRLFGALSADLGQSDVVTYGAQAGINVSF